jgi:DNA-binding response OmpR family regulator
MKLVLSRLDYVVICVGTGREATTALAHTRFALAVLALSIPDTSGIGLARRILSGAGPANRMPILVFGDAWDQEAVLRDCRDAGVDGYLQKPISIGRLVAAVRELTQGDAARNERNPIMTEVLPPIDLQHFRSFTEGDPQLERELGSLYLSTATAYLNEMRLAMRENRDWRSAAHALKGASANIGARDVAALAERSELGRLDDGTLAELDSSLATVRAFFAKRQPETVGDIADID